MDSRATQQCNMSPYVYAVYWLSTASSAFHIGQKMQLTGGSIIGEGGNFHIFVIKMQTSLISFEADCCYGL